jgi:hypothetical protein
MPDIKKNSGLLKFYWLLILLIFPACVSSQNHKSIIMNMSYHDARKIILESGWTPAEGLSSYDEISAVAHHFRDLGYSEVDDCAGAGATSPCLFYFQNQKGEYLKIGTEGEDQGRLYPRVVYAAIRNKID